MVSNLKIIMLLLVSQAIYRVAIKLVLSNVKYSTMVVMEKFAVAKGACMLQNCIEPFIEDPSENLRPTFS